MKEIYISTDIETNGPIPSDNSMLSLGAAAFTSEGKLISTFYATLETLPNSKEDDSTMAWWAQNKEAYDLARKDIRDPKLVMTDYVSWAESLDGKPVFVGYPAGFDFLFVYWYMIHFVGRSPFSFSALDIKTYVMATLKTEYKKSTKKNMPARWFSKNKHTHVAIDDAIEQGELFINILKENLHGTK